MILSAIIMMITTTAFAQYEKGTMIIQPRIGVSAADFNNTDDTEARVGLAAGVEYEYFLSDRFSVAAGLMYSQQGAKLKDIDLTCKLDYFNIPVLANFYLFKGFAIKAGLQAGIKSNAKMELKAGGTTQKADLKDDVKGFDLAIPVGLSYEFKHFVLDARYNLGVTKVFDENALNLDSKNLAFQLTLGYKFAL